MGSGSGDLAAGLGDRGGDVEEIARVALASLDSGSEDLAVGLGRARGAAEEEVELALKNCLCGVKA